MCSEFSMDLSAVEHYDSSLVLESDESQTSMCKLPVKRSDNEKMLLFTRPSRLLVKQGHRNTLTHRVPKTSLSLFHHQLSLLHFHPFKLSVFFLLL